MKSSMKTLLKNFIKCGIFGWCLEIVFTALHSLRRRDLRLKGTTSLYMFPIYGMASFLTPLFHLMKGKSAPVRALTYAGLILTGEYISGSLLSKKELCPWDYKTSKWHIKGIVRLDYLPFWAIAGLLFEKLLASKQPPKVHSPKSVSAKPTR